MSDLPLVSIITPSYNQGPFLEATLRSVLEQDYPRIEYIVMDGGSNDESEDILRRYADRLAYWESQPDRGQAHAINKGLQRARGEILGWINSDDLLLPGTVARAVAALQEHPEADVVYGRLVRIDAQGARVPTPLLPKDRVDFGPERLLGECVVNQPGSFWRRAIMERVGLLDESLRYAMDYEYWIRIAAAGGRFLHLPQDVAAFRLSGGSKTVSQAERMALEQLGVINSYRSQAGLADKLGLPSRRLAGQARQGRSVIGLHVFYGYARRRQWRQALYWLLRAHWDNPLVLFDRRWLDLAFASRRRQKGV